MSSPRPSTRIVALLVGGSLALAACTSRVGDPAPEAGGPDGTRDVTITVAHEQELGAYNSNTSEERAVGNTFVLNQVLRGFWAYGADGSLTPDTEFGTFEQTSQDPLTVEYRMAEGAVWSDGVPIDCDDAMLVWAARSGTYTTGEPDAEGADVPLFSAASTAGYEVMDKPDCVDGDTGWTVTYRQPHADWQAQFGGGEILPAHVVEEQAGGIDLVAAVATDDREALTAAAEFSNTGWVLDPGELDPALTPSSGPYVLDSWQAGQSVTLVANQRWWGPAPKAGTVVVRLVEQQAQAQALANGEIQIAEPQPNPDVIAQLEGLGDRVEILTGDTYTYEHLDYNFRGPFADARVREAFARCVPRRLIVDNLVAPVYPDAVVQDARTVQPFQGSYDEIVATAYDGAYDEPDVAGAQALLEQAGAVGQTVRIAYETPNQRRTNEVELIRGSCERAGFDVQDAGQDDFFGNGLSAGDFDVAVFSWSGSPLVSGWADTFTTGGGGNFGGYTNPELDRLVGELGRTPDRDAQDGLVARIEGILWDDLATLPLFTHPGVAAHAADVTGVVLQPAQTRVSWNMQEWDRAG